MHERYSRVVRQTNQSCRLARRLDPAVLRANLFTTKQLHSNRHKSTIQKLLSLDTATKHRVISPMGIAGKMKIQSALLYWRAGLMRRSQELFYRPKTVHTLEHQEHVVGFFRSVSRLDSMTISQTSFVRNLRQWETRNRRTASDP